MHDPQTLAFSIKWPIEINIWHVDPCRDGTDDSCGWFKRARHGDKIVLEKICKRFEYDWDRVFKSSSGNSYFSGFFAPNGEPYLSVSAITLNLFFLAALEALGNQKRAVSFIQKNLFEILLFGENPVDSLHSSIVLKYGAEGTREERIHAMAACIYGWIIRETQHWWQHPRWHVWHWKIQIHCLQIIWRWLFVRCSVCKGRFKYRETPLSNWDGNAMWHQSCDRTLRPPQSNT